MSVRDDLAAKLRAAAKSLDTASRHCQIAANHVETGEIPRMAAHVLAAHGEIANSGDDLGAVARLHADHSQT